MKRLLLLLCFGIISHVAGSPPAHTNNQTQQTLTFLAKKHLFEEGIYKRSLTPELFWEALHYAEVIEPQIVYKQAIIETGYFTSIMLWRNNNLFGMRLAKVRSTTAIGQIEYHAYYKHWYDSVKDYALWQQYYIERGYSVIEYMAFLQEIGYATDKNYISKLKSISDYS